MDEDFQLITTPLDECINKEKVSKKIVKQILNNEDSVSTDTCALKRKWDDDDVVKNNIDKVYDCLDINKILKSEQDEVKKLKFFKVLSSSKLLTPGILDFCRCNDGNQDYFSKKYISFALCHPTMKCMVVGSKEGTLCVFQIDGENNCAASKPFYFENYPIKGGRLLRDEKRVVFYSQRNIFRVFDLTTTKVQEHRLPGGHNICRMELSPAGDYLFMSTKRQTGAVHVMSTKSFDTVHKLNVSGSVKSMAFSHGGRYLYVFEEQGEISIFDCQPQHQQQQDQYQQYQNVRPTFSRRWVDHGCIEAVCIAISPDNQYIACGSPGNLNVYLLNDCWKSNYPKPVKSIQYEDSRINQLEFCHSSELLAIGYSLQSDPTKGSYRLVHLDSMTVFSNFPGPGASKVRPTSLSFSPGDKFLAVGQYTGRVALFSLAYFNTY